MSVEAFRRVCEKHAKMDLRWFFHDWLDTPGVLSYAVVAVEETRHGGKHMTRVTVARTGEISMPVPVRARFQDGSEQTKWIDHELDFPVVVFESTSPLDAALLDPDKTLPMIERPAPPKPMSLPPRTVADVARAQKGNSVASLIEGNSVASLIGEAMGGYTSADCRRVATYFKRAVQENMEDQNAWLLLGMALYDGKRYEDALVAFSRMADARGQMRGNALVWQGHIHDLLGDRDRAVDRYRAALRVGVTPLQHGQYGIKMNREYTEQHLSHPFTRRDQ
jgi:hypothetical protein